MSGPVGLIAGKGHLPTNVIESIERQGRDVFVVSIIGLTDQVPRDKVGTELSLGQIGKSIEALKSAGCADIVLAGYIQRPELADIQFDEVGMAWLPKIMAAAAQGDDAILSMFLAAFEEAGFNVLGAEQIYTDLLCGEGTLTQTQAGEGQLKDLNKGYRVAGVIGSEDIGQACVVCDGLVLAVEAQEGTNAMLERVAMLDAFLRGTNDTPRGVLVKRTKPGQERRVDLPAIGPDTIGLAVKAGIAGIGLEAGGALIIDRDATLAAADAANIFIVGLPADETGR